MLNLSHSIPERIDSSLNNYNSKEILNRHEITLNVSVSNLTCHVECKFMRQRHQFFPMENLLQVCKI